MPIAVSDVTGDTCLVQARTKTVSRGEIVVTARKHLITGRCPGRFMGLSAAIASALRCTVLADPFLVFVNSIVRRSK